MTDHRTLITQLCAELDHCRRMLLDDRQVTHPLADRARAALAHQPDFRALCAELLLFSEQAGEICTCEGLWPKCDPNYTLLNRANAALVADGPAVPEGREPASVVGEPSDEELLAFVPQGSSESDFYLPKGLPSNWVDGDFIAPPEAVVAFARAVLARWGHQSALPDEGEVAELVADLRGTARGLESQAYPHTAALITRAADLLEQRHPAPVPPAEGEVAELVAWLLEEAVRAANSDASRSAGMLTWAAQVLGEHADLLQRQHPQPVAVSERPWEREGWCDAEGRCWAWHPFDPESDEVGDYWTRIPRHWIDDIGIWSHCLPHYALPTPEATNA